MHQRNVLRILYCFQVCHPFRALHQSPGRMKLGVTVITAGSVLYNIIRFWEYEGIGGWRIGYLLRTNESYYIVYYAALFLVTHFAIPFTLLLVLNTLVMRTIINARRDREKLTRHQKGPVCHSFIMLIKHGCFVPGHLTRPSPYFQASTHALS